MTRIPPTAKSLWPDYLDKIEGKVAIKTGITAALSFFFGFAFSKLFDRPDNLVSGLWCILTALVVLQPHVGGTYKAAWMRFLGILVGSILGSVFTSWFGSSPIPLGISIACTVIVCSLLNLGASFRIATMSVAAVMVLWGLHPETSPWLFGLYRFLDSCLGILIAVIVTHSLWPAQATSTIQQNIAKSLQLISQLYLNGTNLEISREALDKSAHEDVQELNDLIYENLEILDESKIELLIRRHGQENWNTLTHTCESLFEETTILRNIDKRILSLILDDELTKHLTHLIDQTEATLKLFARQLERNAYSTPPLSPLLQETTKALKADLLRFRSTKTTRKFELQDVEGFFVFFYTVVLIAEQIPRLEDNIKKILPGDSAGWQFNQMD